MPDRLVEEQLRALQSVTDAALSYLPLEQMLDELLTRVTELLSCDTAAILLLDEQRDELVARAAKGLEEEVEREVRIPFGRGFAGRVARERRPVMLSRVDPSTVVNPILVEKGLQTMLGVPLLVEGRVIGVLHVGALRPREFTEGDAEVLQRAAERAAFAIAGRLVERERGIATAFQRALIPRLPSIPGIALAGRYMPAAEAQLGGDWYDAFVLPDGRLGVAIGDVVGRGFHAAALMGQLRSGLRAYAIEHGSPDDVLTRLNGLLRQIEPGWGATLLYAVIDLDSRRARFAAAAHPPPFVLDESGSAQLVEMPSSAPLASTRYPEYESVELELPRGSTLLLYTDGVVERPGESLDAGIERLRLALEGEPGDVERKADRLVRELLPGGALADDAALLVVTLCPFLDPFTVKVPAEPDSMPVLRRAMIRWLREAGASREEAGEIVLACAEACANSIEHAYAPGRAEVEVEAARTSPEQVTLTVRDQGSWRPARGTNRGRGLMLMEGLMDQVDVVSSSTGTSVRLTRRLAGSSA